MLLPKNILMLRLVRLSLQFKVVKYQEYIALPSRCLMIAAFTLGKRFKFNLPLLC